MTSPERASEIAKSGLPQGATAGAEKNDLPNCWDDEDGDYLWIQGHHDEATIRACFAKWVKECGLDDDGYGIAGWTELWHLPTQPDDELLHEVQPGTVGAEQFTRVELTW